ncbi:hypothetical protein [Pseudomonas koreensis]|nr:hypothetical protein [Pseudomonas koreensis]
MSDLICRKTMMACRFASECAPHQGCMEEHVVNFDLERMKESLSSPRHTLPPGLSKEGIRAHLLDHAKKLREEVKP